MRELERSGQVLFTRPAPQRRRDPARRDVTSPPEHGGPPIGILVADGHTLLREALMEFLTAEPDFRVVGQADDSLTTVQLVAARRPGAVLLNAGLPDYPVCVTMQWIHRISPGTRIIVLAMHDELALLQEVLAAGAHAVLVKSASRDELVRVIRTVCYEGHSVLVVSQRHAAALAAPAGNPLSRRELQVLELAALALSNAQIAAQLFIVEGTVKRHLTNVYSKLGAVSRLDAVNKAKAARLLKPPVRGRARPGPARRPTRGLPG